MPKQPAERASPDAFAIQPLGKHDVEIHVAFEQDGPASVEAMSHPTMTRCVNARCAATARSRIAGHAVRTRPVTGRPLTGWRSKRWVHRTIRSLASRPRRPLARSMGAPEESPREADRDGKVGIELNRRVDVPCRGVGQRLGNPRRGAVGDGQCHHPDDVRRDRRPSAPRAPHGEGVAGAAAATCPEPSSINTAKPLVSSVRTRLPPCARATRSASIRPRPVRPA